MKAELSTEELRKSSEDSPEKVALGRARSLEGQGEGEGEGEGDGEGGSERDGEEELETERFVAIFLLL
jgi:hypothetical protein